MPVLSGIALLSAQCLTGLSAAEPLESNQSARRWVLEPSLGQFANGVSLSPITEALGATYTWDPVHNGTGSDGSGTWDNSTANFGNGAGDFIWNNTTNANDTAAFGAGGTAGTVTVGNISAGGLLFNSGVSGAYTLQGGALTIANNGTITANAAATVSTAISAGTLNKDGAAALTLGSVTATNFNLLAGSVTQGAGTFTVNGGQFNLAAGSAYNLNAGGTLQAGGANGIGGSGTLNFGGGTLQVINSDLTTATAVNLAGTSESNINTGSLNATFTGAITGTGDLDKSGAGTATLGNIASTGRLYINQGSLISSGANNSVNYLRAVNGGTVGMTVNSGTAFTLNGTTAANPPSTARVIGGTTLNLTNNGQINVTYGAFSVGLSGLGAGTLNIGGTGTLDLDRVASGTYASFFLGVGAGTVGTVTQSNSSVVNTGGAFLLGLDGGSGTYQLNDNSTLKSGTTWSAPHYYIGLNEGAGQTGTVGTLTVSGSSRFQLNANSYLDVGSNLGGSSATGGTGTITQNGAGSLVTFGGSFAAFGSQGAGGTGTYNLQAGTLDAKTGTVSFGDAAGATGVLNQSGGVLTAETGLAIGNLGTGTYNLSAGTATFSAGLSVGAAGLVNQTGGTASLAGGSLTLANQSVGYELNGGSLNIGGPGQNAAVQINSSKLRVGDGAGASGTLSLAAGSSINLDASNNLAYLSIGRSGGTGVFNMTGGTVNATSTSANGFSILFVGASGSTGTLNQSGGTVNGAATTIIGADGATGVYNLTGTGGALFQSPDNNSDPGSHVYIGLNQGASNAATSGTVNIGGNASFVMRSGSYLDVGRTLDDNASYTGGKGYIVQTGGSAVFGGSFAAFGSTNGSRGEYSLSGGTADFQTGAVSFGTTANTTGVLNQSGGVLTAETGLAIGNLGTGTYNLSAGSATFSAGLSVGAAGLVNQTGGTASLAGGSLTLANQSVGYELNGGSLNIGGPGQNAAVQINSSKLRVGDGAGASGTLSLAAGSSINLDASNNLAYLSIGRSGGTGVFNMTGGTVNATSTSANGFSILFVGASGSTGTLNQSGGTVNGAATTIIGADGATGVYNLTGTGGALFQSPDNNSDPGSHVYIGLNQGASNAATSGTVNIGGNASFVMRSGSYLDVGRTLDDNASYTGGKGYIVQTGGSAVFGGSFAAFGSTNGSRGEYSLSGGTADFQTGAVSFGTTANTTGVLNQSGGVLTAETGLAIGNLGTGTYNLSAGSATFSAGLSVGAGSGSTGTITQTGGTLTIGSAGTLNLGQANSSYNLNAGTLQAGGANGINGAGSFNLGGGTLKVIGSGLTTNISTNLAVSTSSTVNTNGFGALLGGVIGGSGALVKTGAGTLTLSSANTYSGGTTVNAGALFVSNTVAGSSATGTGLVTVSNAGTIFGGTGSVAGPVVINGGAAVLGGSPIATGGALTLNGGLTLNPNSIIQLTLGANGTHSSLVRGGGAFTFDPNQLFSFNDVGTNGITVYDNIISGLAGDPGSEANWQISNSGLTGTFVYDNAGGIDLSLTPVPEPSTWIASALLVISAGYGVHRRYRSRRAV